VRTPKLEAGKRDLGARAGKEKEAGQLIDGNEGPQRQVLASVREEEEAGNRRFKRNMKKEEVPCRIETGGKVY